MGSLSHDARILQEHLEIRRNCVRAGWITPKEMVVNVRQRGTSCLGKTGMSPSWRFPELREPLLVRDSWEHAQLLFLLSLWSLPSSLVLWPYCRWGLRSELQQLVWLALWVECPLLGSIFITGFMSPSVKFPHPPPNPVDSGFLVCSSEMAWRRWEKWLVWGKKQWNQIGSWKKVKFYYAFLVLRLSLFFWPRFIPRDYFYSLPDPAKPHGSANLTRFRFHLCFLCTLLFLGRRENPKASFTLLGGPWSLGGGQVGPQAALPRRKPKEAWSVSRISLLFEALPLGLQSWVRGKSWVCLLPMLSSCFTATPPADTDTSGVLGRKKPAVAHAPWFKTEFLPRRVFPHSAARQGATKRHGLRPAEITRRAHSCQGRQLQAYHSGLPASGLS